MLYILTGEIQIGKTRWLEARVAELEAQGVMCEGVLAPGIWRGRSQDEMASIAAGRVDLGAPEFTLGSAGPYEKLGINNMLLPERKIIPFATRRDLAEADHALPDAPSPLKMGWVFSDAAIAQVNTHFDRIIASRRSALNGEGSSQARRFLVVDELGRMELLFNSGLTSAVKLLQTPELFASGWDALIVVREGLLDQAIQKFSPFWPEIQPVHPDNQF